MRVGKQLMEEVEDRGKDLLSGQCEKLMEAQLVIVVHALTHTHCGSCCL